MKIVSRTLQNIIKSYFKDAMKSRFHDYSIPDLPVTTNSPAGALTPAILSEPVEVSKPRGETAQFHCKVKHLGKRKIFYDDRQYF